MGPNDHPAADETRLDLCVGNLHMVTASDVVEASWLNRSMIEPKLEQQADGTFLLTVRRQGEYGKFLVPYVGSHVLLASPDLVVVLIGYHGSTTEKYGRLGYMTQTGQFYRYYRAEAEGTWKQVQWRVFDNEVRKLIIGIVEREGPDWAKQPGQLLEDNTSRHEKS